MDELSASSRRKEVVFCKGSQIGATEAGLNWILYLIDNVPGPILALQPGTDEAATWSKQRVQPSIDACERVRRKVSDTKSRSAGNTILAKQFDGGYFFLRGTNSSRALASIPVGNLYFDEVDRYKLNVQGEGDPISLALRRITNFPRAKAFFSSTPTMEDTSRIWRMYQDSDRRVYEVPCPECGAYQEIKFERLHWIRGDYESVHLICAGCGCPIEEHHKTKMLAKGRWTATNPGHWRAGFHLSALYSPLGWYSWAKAAQEFEEAEGDTDLMIVFTNTILGLPWKESAESLAVDYLARRVEKYDGQVPEGVLMLTMGVDVQDDRLEYEVIGWGQDEESWGIEYRVIRGDPSVLNTGDPSNPSVWTQLDGYRSQTFKKADGYEMRVAITVVDSGGSYTDAVYQYTKARESQWVFSIKGGSDVNKPLLNPVSSGGVIKAKLFVLGVEKGKTAVFTNLKRERPGPGYCHFPSDENLGYDGQFYAGLISERKVKRKGKPAKWEKPRGARNEPFDIRVYSLAAIRLRRPNWEHLREQQNAVRGKGAWKPPQTSPTRARAGRVRKPSGIKLATY